MLWCKILLISRHAIVSFYSLTIFFNFLFRAILILFSDRGLVVRGRPELTLFRQLYWTVFWAFFCSVFIRYVYTDSQISVAPFTRSFVGNVCLQRSLPATADILKGRLSSIAFTSINAFFHGYLSWRVRSKCDTLPNI